MKEKSSICESYVIEVDGEITLNLVNHLAFINKEEITISSLYGDYIDITLTKIDMLKVSKFIREDYPNLSTLNLGNITFEINQNWVIIKSGKNQIEIRPEMFDKIIKYVEEREENKMSESNVTQDIYNKIINSNSNKPVEKVVKPNETEVKTSVNSKSIYDVIVDTISQETKGENKNG